MASGTLITTNAVAIAYAIYDVNPCTLVLFVVVQTGIMQNYVMLLFHVQSYPLSMVLLFTKSHLRDRYQSVLKPLMSLFLLGIF